MKGTAKAFRLEMNNILESRVRFLSNFLIPIIITILLAEVGNAICYWCANGKYTYFNYYASLIFSTSMVFIATQFTVLRIVGERAPYGTLDRDLLAISRAGMYLGKFLAGVVIALIQSFLFLAVGKAIYNMTMEGSFSLSFVFLFFVSLAGLAIGLFFSVITKTKEQAVQLVPFTILIFLVLSGDLIPLRDMPGILKDIAANSPITLANEGLRKVMLEGKSFDDIFAQVMKLFGWVIVMLIFGLTKFATEKK